MYAEREPYYEQEHEIHPQQFEDSFEHGFQAFIPCQQQQDPATDLNAQFQEQVFGRHFGFDPDLEQPEWKDTGEDVDPDGTDPLDPAA
eukprot:405804-Rhodomonas_salina.1